jgi:hypothetical protein
MSCLVSRRRTRKLTGHSHDDNMHLLFPDQRPKVSKRCVKRTLSRDIPLGGSLWLNEIRVDVIRAIIVTLLLESDSREVVWPNIFVPGLTKHVGQKRSRSVMSW